MDLSEILEGLVLAIFLLSIPYFGMGFLIWSMGGQRDCNKELIYKWPLGNDNEEIREIRKRIHLKKKRRRKEAKEEYRKRLDWINSR